MLVFILGHVINGPNQAKWHGLHCHSVATRLDDFIFNIMNLVSISIIQVKNEKVTLNYFYYKKINCKAPVIIKKTIHILKDIPRLCHYK